MITIIGILLAFGLTTFLSKHLKSRVNDGILLVAVFLFISWIFVANGHRDPKTTVLRLTISIGFSEIFFRLYRTTTFWRKRQMQRAAKLARTVIPILEKTDNPREAKRLIARATRWCSVGMPHIDEDVWPETRTVLFEDISFGDPYFSMPHEIEITLVQDHSATTRTDLSVN